MINGQTYSATWGQGATAAGIASSLASAISAGTLVTASASGGVITLTADAQGASTNYSLSASSSSPLNSFTAVASGATLTGGVDATPDVPAHSVWQGVWTTQYSYDALGNLSCVEQHGDATGTGCPTLPFSPTSPVPPDTSNPWRLRRFGYNSLGELLWASNPESGVITYSYDPAGNVSEKTSPAPNQTGTATTTISYCYDPDDRLLAKGYSTSPNPPQQCSSTAPYLPSPAVTNTYDAGLNGIGRLTSLTDQAGSGSYTYDVMGRINTEQRTIGGITKSMSYGYDLAGSPTQITYPSTRVVNYTADSAGREVSAVDGNLTKYATTGSYNAAGSLASFASGSSITNSFLYNPRLQLCRITAWTSGSVPSSCTDAAVHGNLMDRGYDFSLGAGDNGNVLGITNYRDSSRSQSFTYDSVNRIVTGSTSGNTGALSWGENYTIDPWGNLQISPMAGKAQGGNFQHAGDVDNRASGLGYDAAGNLTDYTAPGQYVYDSENRIQSTGGMTYTYDADGNRVEKSSGSTGTLYWYGLPGILAESDLAGNLKSEYVFFNGKRTARIDLPGNTVHYYLSDHLNSTSMVVSSAGVPEEESDYSPFGTEYVVSGTGANHYKFTGKERDSESGLDYFGARYYGSALGRFITPDELLVDQDTDDPQSWNLYTYVRNNPEANVDSDGRKCDSGTVDKKGNFTLHCSVNRPSGDKLPWYDFVGYWWVGFVNLATDHPARGAAQIGYAYGANAVAGLAIEAAVSTTGSLIEGLDASLAQALEEATENAKTFKVPLKHMAGAAGRYAKFAAGVDANAVIEEALSSSKATVSSNPGSANSFTVVTDLGRTVGSQGQTAVKVIVGSDGKIWTAYPVNAPKP